MPWLAELVALIAPPGCCACGRALVGAGERLCVLCTRRLPWLPAGCPRCALPSHRAGHCPAAGAAFPRAWAPLIYDGVARRLILGLKVRNALPTADLMAAHIAANLPPDLRAALAPPLPAGELPSPGSPAGVPLPGRPVGMPPPGWGAAGPSSPRSSTGAPPPGWGAAGPSSPRSSTGAPLSAGPLTGEVSPDQRGGQGDRVALVPVPALRSRRRRRGFDPAHALTVRLGGRLQVPVANCLVRTDRTARQVGASRRERRAPGRLLVRAHGPVPPRAILVDDVHTTGTTLDTCARALTAAGSTVVAAISYARTL